MSESLVAERLAAEPLIKGIIHSSPARGQLVGLRGGRGSLPLVRRGPIWYIHVYT